MTPEELQLKYNYLKNKVIELLDCQQEYFKSNKDYQLLKKSKAIEKELIQICKPKPTQQQSFFSEEFLAL